METAAQIRNHYLDERIQAAMTDFDEEVAKTAQAAAQRLRIQPPGEDTTPKIGSLPTEQAIAQVLASEGAQRFTTARVAERAGVSIGSLYQYFPNKAAILFRLQSDEWRRTTRLLGEILEDTARPPAAAMTSARLANSWPRTSARRGGSGRGGGGVAGCGSGSSAASSVTTSLR